MNRDINILIVDDQPANLDLLIKTLEPEDYKILTALNGEIALNITPRANPDLILLDIMMPGLDGYAVCHQLKQDKSTQEIPIIFVTALGESEDIVKGFQLGGVDYITKPFKDGEVLARVKTHLKISQLTRELMEKNQQLEREIRSRKQAEEAFQRAKEPAYPSVLKRWKR